MEGEAEETENRHKQRRSRWRKTPRLWKANQGNEEYACGYKLVTLQKAVGTENVKKKKSELQPIHTLNTFTNN